MASQIILRDYQTKDHARVKANLIQAKMYYEDMDGKSLLKRMIKKDPESIVIAEDEGTIVGSAYFIDLGFTAMLWRLNVIPKYQKKNIGKQLISEVQKKAKSRGFTQLHFTVHEEHSRLIKWYQEQGA